MESNIILDGDPDFIDQEHWELLKKHQHKKKSPLRQIKAEKTQLKRLPGKRIPKKEKTNRDRFSKLSLSVDKVKPVKQRSEKVSESKDVAGRDSVASGARDLYSSYIENSYNTTAREHTQLSKLSDTGFSSSTPIKASALKKLLRPATQNQQKKGKSNNKQEKGRIVENSGDILKFLHRNLTNEDGINNEPYDRGGRMKTKSQAGPSGSPSRGSRNQHPQRIEEEYKEDNLDTDRHENDSALPPITDRSEYDNQQSPSTSRRVPVHERLYDPDYKKHRQSYAEQEPVYNRDFKARLPKNLEHVTSKFMDPEYFEPKEFPEPEIEEFPQVKPYIPKSLEHVKSKILDPGYYEPKGEYVLDTEEHQAFKARLPKNMEHVQSRHLNPEYFQKRSSPDPALYDQHNKIFTARLPKGMEHVESRILDDKYFTPKPIPEKDEHYDTEFKAHLPRHLDHVAPRLLDPKKPKDPPKEETEVFQTVFRAKPPKRLGHVESRILDPSYFEPKPSYITEEDPELQTEFRSKPPKALQHVEKRIYDPRFYQKKEQTKPTSEDIEVQNMHTDFKAKIPKNMQHVKSKAFDLAMAKSPSRLSDSSVLELKNKGPVVVIKVKKATSPRAYNTPSYTERLHAGKTQEKEYYQQWRKEFDDQVREIREDKKFEIKFLKADGEKSGSRGTNKNYVGRNRDIKSIPQAFQSPPPNPSPEPVKEEEVKEVKKPRKPWRPPRRPKAELVDKNYFDSWVMTPTHIYRGDNRDMFMTNRRNVSEMWNDLATSIDQSSADTRRIRSVERHMYY